LAKRYRLAASAKPLQTLRDSVSRLFADENGDAAAPDETRWAVAKRHLFDCAGGQALVVIGRNRRGQIELL